MAARLIALDWGTSSLRAYLLGDGGKLIEERAKPCGILHVKEGSFGEAYDTIVGEWRQRWPDLPALAARMIGNAKATRWAMNA